MGLGGLEGGGVEQAVAAWPPQQAEHELSRVAASPAQGATQHRASPPCHTCRRQQVRRVLHAAGEGVCF